MDFDYFRIFRFAAIAITFIIALLYWQRYKNSHQKSIPFYLGFVLLLEIVATIGVVYSHRDPANIYLIYTVVSVFYFLNWFRLILSGAIVPKASLVFFVVYILLGSLYFNTLGGNLKHLISVGSILILVNSFTYFISLLKSDEVIKFLRLQQFWIVAGMVLFYIGFFPVHILQPYMIKDNQNWIRLFITILNILQYGFFTISFLCLRRKN